VIPVVWARDALADIQRIRRYIADFNPYAARDMAQRILEAGDDLATFPFRGRAVPDRRSKSRKRKSWRGNVSSAISRTAAEVRIFRLPVAMQRGLSHQDCGASLTATPLKPKIRRC
jgi:plasmid stabilization system protein ParE